MQLVAICLYFNGYDALVEGARVTGVVLNPFSAAAPKFNNCVSKQLVTTLIQTGPCPVGMAILAPSTRKQLERNEGCVRTLSLTI